MLIKQAVKMFGVGKFEGDTGGELIKAIQSWSTGG